ncbi:hypothetical protein [Actinoplanes sp. NPDC026623]|uniref:hypothetical protein n=1 Tax=Actinoplanes sp. NPDC026623 TaxID=3155610 RepID=UPI0033FC9A82
MATEGIGVLVHKPRRMSSCLTLVGLLAVGGPAGCAPAGDRAPAAATAAAGFFRAIGAGDGTAACAVLAPDTAAEVAQSDDRPCPEAILRQDLPAPGPVTGSEVFGQWAQVRLTGDTVFLAAFPGGWRVVAAGCTRRAGRPYDCAVRGG